MAKSKKKKTVVRKKAVKPTVKKKTNKRGSNKGKDQSKKAKSKKVRSKKSYNTSGFRKYQITVAAIRQYYKDSGRDISRDEANRIYHELKGQFKDVRLKYIEGGVEEYLKGKERKKLPTSLLVFTWYLLNDVLTDNEAVGYFRNTDTIVLDLSILGLKEFSFNYGNEDHIHKVYRDLYSTIKPLVKKKFSPEPQLRYEGEKDSVYTWILYADKGTETEAPEVPEEEEEIEEVPEVKRPAIDKEEIQRQEKQREQENERLALEIELEKQKQATSEKQLLIADKLLVLIDKGLTVEQAMKVLGIK